MMPPMGPSLALNQCAEISGPMYQCDYEKHVEKHALLISGHLTTAPMLEHTFGFLFRQARFDVGSTDRNRSADEIMRDLLEAIVRNVAYRKEMAYGDKISILQFLDNALWENGVPLQCDPRRNMHLDMVLTELIPTLHDGNLFNSTIRRLGSNLVHQEDENPSTSFTRMPVMG